MSCSNKTPNTIKVVLGGLVDETPISFYFLVLQGSCWILLEATPTLGYNYQGSQPLSE